MSDPKSKNAGVEAKQDTLTDTSPKRKRRLSEFVRSSQTETFWQWIRVTARLWGFLLFVLLILFIFRDVVLPFSIALLLTYVLAPLLSYLCQLKIGGRSLPRSFWLVSMYIVLLGFLTLSATYLAPKLATDLKRGANELPGLLHRARVNWVPRMTNRIQSFFANIPDTSNAPTDSSINSDDAKGVAVEKTLSDRIIVESTNNGRGLRIDLSDVDIQVHQSKKNVWQISTKENSEIALAKRPFPETIGPYLQTKLADYETGLLGIVNWTRKVAVTVMHIMTTTLLVLMISAFLLMDTSRFLTWLRGLIPISYHEDFDSVIKLIDKALSGAIRGQFLIMLINGILTGVGLFIFKVKYALLLAILAGLLSLIPIFGTILSSLPIIVAALFSGDAGFNIVKGVSIAIWILVIHLIEANFLNPKIIGRAARIHPVIVIFAVVAGEHSFGIAGALFAVPILSAIQAMFIYLRQKAVKASPSTLTT